MGTYNRSDIWVVGVEVVELHSLWCWIQDWYLEYDGMICEDDEQLYVSSTEANGTSADVDAPYSWCWEYRGVYTCNMESESVDSDSDKDGQ